MSRIRNFFIICIITLSHLCSYSEDEQTTEFSFDENKVIGAVPLEGAIQLDGVLDEAGWSKCEPITGFRQRDPQEGEPASEKTEIRILFSEKYLYIGFQCFDSEPEKIIARYMRRDSRLWDDDSVHIMLDPFANGQNGFMFSTNALGARYDALINGSRRSTRRRLSGTRQAAYPQSSWNGVWNVKAQKNENGWSAEFEIPFSSLKFPRLETQTWGINFRRMIARRTEESLWAAHPKKLGFYSLSHAGSLTGLSGIEQGIGLDIKPYGVTSYKVVRDPGNDDDMVGQVGLDVSYSITSDIRMDVAINPDFAETEVDEQPMSLSRFPLFFPEKRRFFLEGSSVFEFGSAYRAMPYFSRRIGLDEDRKPVSILQGTKVTGTVGDTSFGVLNAMTSEQGETPSTIFNVLRVQEQVFEESNVGMIVTNKLPDGGFDNHVVGIDGSFSTFLFEDEKRLRSDFYAMQSFSDVEDGDDFAGYASVSYPNDPWDISASIMRIGPDFNPEVGFVRQKGLDQLDFNFIYTPDNDLPWLRRTAHSVETEYSIDEDGNQYQWEIEFVPLGLVFESGDYLQYEYTWESDNVRESFDIFDGFMVHDDRYRTGHHMVSFRSSPRRRMSFMVYYFNGESFNGDMERCFAEGRIQATKKLSFSLEGSFDSRDYPMFTDSAGEAFGGEFTAKLARFRTTYTFSPDMYITSYLQWENESELASLNTRYHWTIAPERDLFVVLNLSGNRETRTFIQADTSIKVGYLWRF